MDDTSPTMDDTTPTLPMKGEESEAEEPVEEGAAGEEPDIVSGPAMPAATVCKDGEAASSSHGKPAAEEGEPAAEEVEESTDSAGAEMDGFATTTGTPPCVPDPGVNAFGDALPLVKDGAGNLVPLGNGGGSASETAVMERLGERRTELESREQELEMRMALVEAAEQRIAERTAVLEALEAKINSLVDQNNAEGEAQFKSVVSMYETMKPKEAAGILNELDMETLLRVARAMNPRKMAPIMAKMDPTKAKDLTANMAVAQAEPTIAITQEDLASLPQIVGQ